MGHFPLNLQEPGKNLTSAGTRCSARSSEAKAGWVACSKCWQVGPDSKVAVVGLGGLGLLKSDVKYRFVIDMASLKNED